MHEAADCDLAVSRLTSLVFKEECLVTACQDGYVCTWARPGVNQHPVTPSPTSQVSPELRVSSSLHLVFRAGVAVRGLEVQEHPGVPAQSCDNRVTSRDKLQ